MYLLSRFAKFDRFVLQGRADLKVDVLVAKASAVKKPKGAHPGQVGRGGVGHSRGRAVAWVQRRASMYCLGLCLGNKHDRKEVKVLDRCTEWFRCR